MRRGKAGLLGLVDHAVGEGWSLQAVCEVLKISRRRVERWQARRTDLADRKPGGVAVNGLLDDEVQQILAVFNEGERDRSHRRLAHRGSYVGRFWASPSTVRRVLIESDKHFRPLGRDAVPGQPRRIGVDEHVVRHEALLFRMEVRDLHRPAVVAAG